MVMPGALHTISPGAALRENDSSSTVASTKDLPLRKSPYHGYGIHLNGGLMVCKVGPVTPRFS